MERRALLRSLGLLGLGAVATACGSRTTTGRSAGPEDSSTEPPGARTTGDGGGRRATPDGDERPDAAGSTADPDAAAPDAGAPDPADPDPDPGPGDDGGNEATPARTVEVICREAVGLTTAAATTATHRLDRLTLHHTAVRLPSSALAPSRLRGHQRYHRDQGWIDIAYHYAVDLAGNVYELRDPDVPGDTFTDYDTNGHLQVVCEGDFQAQEPTDAMVDGLAGLLAALARRHGLSPATLDTHRTYAPSTTCPGDRLLARLDDVRTTVRRLHAAQDAALELRCGPEAEARVARIEAA